MKSFRILSVATALAISLMAGEITFDGDSVTPQDIVNVANGEKIKISKDALQKVRCAHEILLNAAKDG